jgi:hypothetical protein
MKIKVTVREADAAFVWGVVTGVIFLTAVLVSLGVL